MMASCNETETLCEQNSKSQKIKAPMHLIPYIVAYQKNLQIYEHKIKDIIVQQELLTSNLNKENSRYADMESTMSNLKHLFKLVSLYTQKLNTLRSEMIIIEEKVAKCKERAAIVKSFQEHRKQELQILKKQQEQREKLLTAKPVWETNPS